MNRLQSSKASNANSQVRLVSVLSGKGGVGKSVIAFNLSERLAAEGYRVLLVDADSDCGNQHILANIDAELGLANYVRGDFSLTEVITPINSLFDLLASPESLNLSDDFEARPSMAELVSRLRTDARAYDLVIIDQPSGINNQITEIAKLSDLNLLVILPELLSISDGYGLFKRLASAGQLNSCQLLINRTESEAETEHIVGKFRALTDRFLGQVPGFAGQIAESDIIKTAVGRQQAIAAVAPQSIETESFREIGRQLVRSLKIGLSNTGNQNNRDINVSAASADTRG